MTMPAPGDYLRNGGMYPANAVPGLGRSHSSSKEDKMACSFPISASFWAATCLGTSRTQSL
jgi:hypothetical protein